MRDYYYDTWIEDGNEPIGYRKTGWFKTKRVPAKNARALQAGMEIPAFTQGPVTRTEIVKYAAASWDFNPVHHDEIFAKQARSGGIIAHGMMIFAYLGRVATDFLGTPTLSKLSARFMNVTRPGDILTLGGKVESVDADGRVVLQLSAVNQKGETVATGVAHATLRP
jgi:acyl dehydratase